MCLSSRKYAAFCTHNFQTKGGSKNSDVGDGHLQKVQKHSIHKIFPLSAKFLKTRWTTVQIETFLSENVVLRPCRDQPQLLLRTVIETGRSHFHYYGGFTSDLMNEKPAQEAISTKPIKEPILRTVENASFSTQAYLASKLWVITSNLVAFWRNIICQIEKLSTCVK